MASQLKVYVSLAHTLAPAGKVHARNAACSNSDDEAPVISINMPFVHNSIVKWCLSGADTQRN